MMRRFHVGLLGVLLAACQSVPSPVANQQEIIEQPLEQKAIGGPATTDGDTSSSAAELINPTKPKRTVTVAVVSDLNSSYGSLEYTQDVHRGVSWLVERQPDLVISSGDMVAGQRANLDYLGMWGAFHSIVSDQLAVAGIPFAVSPGNHDASASPNFANEREIFVEQWSARRPQVKMLDSAHYPLRYAFEKDGVLFVSLDVTTTIAMNKVQLSWLNRVLTENSQYPAKFVFGHVPLHLFAENRESEVLTTADLEPLLELHGVSAFVTGHHHVYYPGIKNGVRYISAPCLGTGPRRVDGSINKSPRGILMLHVQPESGEFTYEAKMAPDFSGVIRTSELPTSVGYGPKSVGRDH